MSDLSTFPYIPHIEWETLDQADMGRFTSFSELGPLPATTSRVRLSRTDDFALVGTATCSFEGGEAYQRATAELRGTGTPGAITRGSVIDASNDHETLRIDGAFVRGYKTHFEPYNERIDVKCEVAVGLSRFVWKMKDQSAIWLTDWFLNGTGDFVWTGSSSWKGEAWSERSRSSNELTPGRKVRGAGQEVTTWDHFTVKCDAVSFIVHQVPDSFGPSWSKNIGIEYELRPDGTFPDDETRTAVAELLSFVFGRRLMHVATTSFNDAGYAVQVMAMQPWGHSVRAVCAMVEPPPINVSQTRGGTRIDVLITALLPRYLELRSTLRLGESLWRLWLGDEASLGLNLPIYSAGLDMLASAWFKSSRSKSKGVYMPKSDFDRLLADVFTQASQRLAQVQHGDRMLRKMKGAFQTSVREATEWFFEEIDLPIGEFERSAMKARNAPAHGGDGGVSDKEIDDLIWHAHAYRVLFARTILRILGYTGRYIDHRTPGYPERELLVPAGG